MDVNFECVEDFLDNILINTSHTIDSLSKILGIPRRRLLSVKKITKTDYIKLNELKQIIKDAGCKWYNDMIIK